MRRRDLFKMFPAVAAVAAVPATSLVLNAGTKLNVKLTGDVPKPLAPSPRPEDSFQKLRPSGQVEYAGMLSGVYRNIPFFATSTRYRYRDYLIGWTGWKESQNTIIPAGQWVASKWNFTTGEFVGIYQTARTLENQEIKLERRGICSSFPGVVAMYRVGEQFDVSFTDAQCALVGSLSKNGVSFWDGIRSFDNLHPLQLHAFGEILNFIDETYIKETKTVSYGPRAISGTA